MEQGLKQRAFKGVFWKIFETGGKQVIQLGISIVLARLIAPAQFGVIAMLAIFLAVATTFIDAGFSTALIRKNDRTQADCCTVYYFNIVVSLLAYGILYAIAPLVADFYGMAELKPVLRVVSLSIVIGALCGVHAALLNAEMRFNVLAKYGILSLVISGTVGIVMAFKGFQVWALVAQQLTATAIGNLFIFIKSRWRPSLVFSWASLKEFFTFGSKLLASGLLNTVYENMYSVIIGKVYKASDLAFFNRASQLKGIATETPTAILQSVTYPTFCKIQDDIEALRSGYRRTIRVSAYVIFPLALGLAAVAYPLINVLYTTTWIFSASLLTILAFAGMWYPIHAINLNLLIVKGRSDLFFRLEIVKKVIGVTMLCITVPIGLKAMCYGMICTSVIALFINSYYTGKLYNLGIWLQLRDLLPVLLLSMTMFAVVKMLTLHLGMDAISLAAGILTGIIIYLGGSYLFRFPELQELLSWRG